ncbi:DUF418 domain-containing protein [Amycolatopsis lurida]
MDGVTSAQARAGVLDDDRTLLPGRRALRLTGVDVARGVAVLGMYAVHVGPHPAHGGLNLAFLPFEGRSAALFAVLAGVSIALMSGGEVPKTGRPWAQVVLRLLTRAPLLIALGLFLTNLHTGYLIILAYYGACFVLAIPFLRLGIPALIAGAAFCATVMPFLSFAIRSHVAPRDLVLWIPDATIETFSTASFDYILQVLLLTGTFPAVSLMAYIFAGMAIGRMNLRSELVCRRLVAGGAITAAVAYTTSWLATDVLGGREEIYRSLIPAAGAAGMSPAEFYEQNVNQSFGTPPTTTLAWEFVANGHSYTPFDLVGCIGISAAAIGGCMLLARRHGRLLRPIADLGSIALTAYAGHFVAIWWFFREKDAFSLTHWLWFGGVAVVFAVAWKKWIGRGPLEWVLHQASRWPGKLIPKRG